MRQINENIKGKKLMGEKSCNKGMNEQTRGLNETNGLNLIIEFYLD